MPIRRLPVLALVTLAAAGCASATPAGLTGGRSARVSADWGEHEPRPAVVPVEHVFELTNRGTEPATIVAHRTPIDTIWHFADTGDGRLPRSIAPGETVAVVVTAKVRRSGPQTRRVQLRLAGDEVIELELLVDG